MAAVCRPWLGEVQGSGTAQGGIALLGVEAAALLLQAAVRAGATRHVASAVVVALLRTLCDAASTSSGDLADRTGVVGAALEAHGLLNAISGKPAHNLGTATAAAAAKGVISQPEVRALRSLRRRANKSKHHWDATGPLSAVANDWWQVGEMMRNMAVVGQNAK